MGKNEGAYGPSQRRRCCVYGRRCVWLFAHSGLWMLPLGLALIALDLPPTRKIIERWMERLETDLDA